MSYINPRPFVLPLPPLITTFHCAWCGKGPQRKVNRVQKYCLGRCQREAQRAQDRRRNARRRNAG